MDVREIVAKHLADNGYDGLWSDNCGCSTDDLMPCDSNIGNCRPGYKTEGCDCGESHDFHIGPNKTK